MRGPSSALRRFGPALLVLLAAVPFAAGFPALAGAGGQATPPESGNIGLKVSRSVISSHVSLQLSGLRPARDANGKLAEPPSWQVLAADGKKVASGKFEFG